MFKNFHLPEVTLASGQPFDPRSRPQHRPRSNSLRGRDYLSISILKRNSVTSSNVCSLLVASSYHLTFSTGFGGSLRSRAHIRSFQSFKTFYSSADPLLHRRPATNDQGRPHDCSMSAAVGGSMWSRMRVISNLPDSSPAYPVLPLPSLQHQCHEPPVTRIHSSSSPNSANSAGNLSDAATTLAHPKLKPASDDAHRISVPALA